MDSATAAALGALAVTVLGAAVGWYLKIAGDRHVKQREIRGDTLQEFREVLDHREKENDAQNHQIAKLRDREDVLVAKLSLCYQNYARAEERIAALEELLASKDIPFRKWVTRAASADSSSSIDTRP